MRSLPTIIYESGIYTLKQTNKTKKKKKQNFKITRKNFNFYIGE